MADASAQVNAAITSQRWSETGRLSLHGLGIQELSSPPPVEMADLVALDLSGNRFKSVPEWLQYLPRLENLSLAGNRLTTLGGISAAINLQALDVSENRLRSLPVELGDCHQLRWLNLSFNQITTLAPLAGLTSLEALDISRNRLTTLESLPSLANLRRLDASGNNLTRLWSPNSDLHSLRWLDLARNRLTAEVLEALANLPLTELFLDQNNIDRSPSWLDRIRLRRFSGGGNPWEIDPSVLTESTDDRDVRVEVDSLIQEEPSYGLNFDKSPYSFGFQLEAYAPENSAQVVDLYYKGYPSLPAVLRIGDAVELPLSSMTRQSALDRVLGGMEADAVAKLTLPATREDSVRNLGAAFAAEALRRVEDLDLVSRTTGKRHHISWESAPRVVNAEIRVASGVPLPASASLLPNDHYLLCVWIGQDTGQSLVLNPAMLPVSDLEPNSSFGWWFDVVVTSPSVEVERNEHRLLLPFAGASRTLNIPFRTGNRESKGTLRCTVYYENNAMQSFRLTFSVGTGAPSVAIHAVVDYVLTHDLGHAVEFKSRQLNLLTNESNGGRHTIVVKGADLPATSSNLRESDVNGVLAPIRQQLELITLGRNHQTQYDSNNAASEQQLQVDLKTLAHHGWSFLQAAIPNVMVRIQLQTALRSTSKIQISRAGRTVFPWALVYDGPRQGKDEWNPCELLTNWSDSKERLADYPEECPFGPHLELNVLCPFNFWGFRHLIEQPPSVLEGQLPTSLILRGDARAATVRSLDLDENLSRAHLQSLEDIFSKRFHVTDCDSRADLIAAINMPATPVIYFYCHGTVRLMGDVGVDRQEPYLEIGHGEAIATGDLTAWALAKQWSPELWLDVRPLVFINGCHTAALSPEQVVDFVNAFAGANAAGVVGTEIAVAQPVASEFAQRFYEHFMGGNPMTVGQAMRRARLDLLAKGNVAGLVYTAFCSMDLAFDSD
ncbi:leucine-rich repeat domain-containing protein (plasmid) [Rhodococcus aetherivorans]|uniref:Leucine-rich repeat domain-containing protein n=1 Tax=Rhodococcus aetherivorans TaxID=191292 RepID=A0AA46SGM7_9NOCA|nr:leucine-rich repeat domain-containing protein [Rhodococcus aetherivorans]UYF97127.1 leucine-rich repeat domain-containing protein [Rhodococcus aetherivorans]